MPVTRHINISITDDAVNVFWPDGTSHAGHFAMSPNDLYNKVMSDLTTAMYPLLEKAGDTQYCDQFKGVPSDSARDNGELQIIENECDENKYELTYWEGQWSCRRSGETATMTGTELFLILMQMKGAA